MGTVGGKAGEVVIGDTFAMCVLGEGYESLECYWCFTCFCFHLTNESVKERHLVSVYEGNIAR